MHLTGDRSSLPEGTPVVKRACLGLFTRRPRWGLSWRGWLLALALLATAGAVAAWRIHPFLAVTERVETRALVVEGWLPGFALKTAAEEFQKGGYETLYLIGLPPALEGAGQGKVSLPGAVRRLIQAGVPEEAIRLVSGGGTRRDRTYGNAAAFRRWLAEHRIPLDSFNVVTLGVHGRRSWIMVRTAFDETVKTGVISVLDPEYDPGHWWRYSRGVKEVVSEAAAYLYANTLFRKE